VFRTETERQNLYTQLKTAAESGWDFSTRWYITNSTQKGKLRFINTEFSRHMSMTGDRQI
jgi:Trehalase.